MTAPRTGKTGSRNPANREPRQQKAAPTPVSAWKKSAEIPILELPSGNAMRVKKIGLQSLMATGIIPNSLMGFVQKAVAKGKAEQVTEDDMAALLADENRIREITELMDKVTVLCAQEPEVHPLPDEGVERDDEALYIDEVDGEDKMFIFQVVCGGTTDLEQFRAEQQRNVAPLHRRENVGGSSQRPRRNRR